jgi:hypothetical protein
MKVAQQQFPQSGMVLLLCVLVLAYAVTYAEGDAQQNGEYCHHR